MQFHNFRFDLEQVRFSFYGFPPLGFEGLIQVFGIDFTHVQTIIFLVSFRVTSSIIFFRDCTGSYLFPEPTIQFTVFILAYVVSFRFELFDKLSEISGLTIGLLEQSFVETALNIGVLEKEDVSDEFPEVSHFADFLGE